jgi:molybdopterin synthase sulfur carrier subunit
MRDLTGGQSEVIVEGRTLRELVDALERAYPGVRARLLEDAALDPAIRALVDGRAAPLGLDTRVSEDSEVQFIPAIAGG